MPLYQYECESCKSKHEVFHSLSAEPPPCPGCGEHALKRVFDSAPGKPRRIAVASTPKQRVEDFIANAKEDLKEQANKYRGRKHD